MRIYALSESVRVGLGWPYLNESTGRVELLGGSDRPAEGWRRLTGDEVLRNQDFVTGWVEAEKNGFGGWVILRRL